MLRSVQQGHQLFISCLSSCNQHCMIDHFKITILMPAGSNYSDGPPQGSDHSNVTSHFVFLLIPLYLSPQVRGELEEVLKYWLLFCCLYVHLDLLLMIYKDFVVQYVLHNRAGLLPVVK